MTEIVWDESLEPNAGIEELLHDTVRTALRLNKRAGSVCILITDEAEILRLNTEFRSIERVTDVLSFPALSEEDGDKTFLGDIAICLQRAMEQASLYGHGLEREMAFLTAHGCLHLLGYDHIEPEEELIMRARQNEIMKEMGLAIHE